MASDIRLLSSFDPKSQAALQNGQTVVAGDGRRFTFINGQAVVENSPTFTQMVSQANGVAAPPNGQPFASAAGPQGTPVSAAPQTAAPVAAPIAPPAAAVPATAPATGATATPAVAGGFDPNSDPEYLAAIAGLDALMGNQRADYDAGVIGTRAKFGRLLRSAGEKLPGDLKNSTEQSAGRGMLRSGGYLEQQGGIRKAFADYVANTNEDQTSQLNDLVRSFTAAQASNNSDRQSAMAAAARRRADSIANSANTAPVAAAAPVAPVTAAAPVAPVPVAATPAPVAAPAAASDFATPTPGTRPNDPISPLQVGTRNDPAAAALWAMYGNKPTPRSKPWNGR